MQKETDGIDDPFLQFSKFGNDPILPEYVRPKINDLGLVNGCNDPGALSPWQGSIQKPIDFDMYRVPIGGKQDPRFYTDEPDQIDLDSYKQDCAINQYGDQYEEKDD